MRTRKAKHLHKGEPPRNENFLRKLLPGKERVLCLREADGKILWVHEYDCPYTVVATYATGPRVTPAVDDGRVYSIGTEGHLFCLGATPARDSRTESTSGRATRHRPETDPPAGRTSSRSATRAAISSRTISEISSWPG